MQQGEHTGENVLQKKKKEFLMVLGLKRSLLAKLLLISGLFFLLCVPSIVVCPKSASAASTSQQRAASLSCPPTLQKGSSGTWVKALQYRLNFEYSWRSHYGSPYGFPNSPYNFHPLLSTDGQFGQNTYNAVWDYQTGQNQNDPGISIDGNVGPQTWSQLGFC